ncbi:putative Dolichyldiphosphatase [Cardiosporidium cionae]|uniref:Dolichyldiphosphatase n=1 Tax=Cardiosporidium cionae TaxID=476202 RepID=A0ABQ7JEF0_9APIC|nr:putative Dolichyldiphosphatase [Cardiosporidium cionae]|eukprot:KAF8822373.1 putative Dolichyldiphosphatase [Cardiosporidium cionae]
MSADCTILILPASDIDRTSSITSFGTFTVPNWKYGREHEASNQSIYPSTHSTVLPSAAMNFSLHTDEEYSNLSQGNFSVDDDASKNAPSKSRPKRNGRGAVPSSHTCELAVKDSLRRLGFFSMLRDLLKINIGGRVYHSIGSDIEAGLPDQYAFSFLSVSYRSPLSIPIFLALLYSYVPFLAFFLHFVGFFFTTSAIPFFVVSILSITAALNEVLIKNIFRESRPLGSLVQSYGMPSSHCMVSYGVLTWSLLEFLFPQDILLFSLLHFLLICAIFIPVPWARFYLDDHTPRQCVYGCLGGAIFGILAYALRHFFISPILSVK